MFGGVQSWLRVGFRQLGFAIGSPARRHSVRRGGDRGPAAHLSALLRSRPSTPKAEPAFESPRDHQPRDRCHGLPARHSSWATRMGRRCVATRVARYWNEARAHHDASAGASWSAVGANRYARGLLEQPLARAHDRGVSAKRVANLALCKQTRALGGAVCASWFRCCAQAQQRRRSLRARASCVAKCCAHAARRGAARSASIPARRALDCRSTLPSGIYSLRLRSSALESARVSIDTKGVVMPRSAAVLLGLSFPFALLACEMQDGRRHWHHSDYDPGCYSDSDCPLHSSCASNGACIPDQPSSQGQAHGGASGSTHGAAGHTASAGACDSGGTSGDSETSGAAGESDESDSGGAKGSSGSNGSSAGSPATHAGGSAGLGPVGSSASAGSAGHSAGGSSGTVGALSCDSNTDCSAGDCCLSGVCKPVATQPTKCHFSSECGSNGRCFDGSCQPACSVTVDCGTADECRSGFCQPKPGSGGQCVYNSDCPLAGSVCLNGTCLRPCSSAAQCSAQDSCVNGTCQADHGPKPGCTANADCNAGKVCVNAVCRSGCQTSADCCSCTTATVCDEGFCVSPGEAAPQCALASSCGVGAHCVDALCSAP